MSPVGKALVHSTHMNTSYETLVKCIWVSDVSEYSWLPFEVGMRDENLPNALEYIYIDQ